MLCRAVGFAELGGNQSGFIPDFDVGRTLIADGMLGLRESGISIMRDNFDCRRAPCVSEHTAILFHMTSPRIF